MEDYKAKCEELEQQVAVLRNALGDLVEDLRVRIVDGERFNPGTIHAHQRAAEALNEYQPTGWVRLADVERVMRPLIRSTDDLDKRGLFLAEVAAARAWLEKQKT